MPNITLLPTITSVTNATTFVIVDNRLTKRVNYSSFLNQISTDLLAVGFRGNTGNTGTNGVGVIAGGTVNQVLAKIDSANYNTKWLTLSAVSTSGARTSVSKTESTPWSTPRIRSRPAPVSMFFFGNSVS